METFTHRSMFLMTLAVLALAAMASGCKNETVLAPDKASPAIEVVYPLEGARLHMTDTIVVSGSDNRGITKVEIYINSVLAYTFTSAHGPWGLIWNTTGVPDGAYTISARAYDNAGNVGESATVNILVANAFPVLVRNVLYTDLSFTLAGVLHTVTSNTSSVFTLSVNPGTLSWSASTSGKTTTGTQVGGMVTWNYSWDVSTAFGDTITPVVGSGSFFLLISNQGNTTLGPVYVNYGNSYYQTIDYISLPKSATTYRLGYYHAASGGQVRAYWSSPTTTYTYWTEGTHFTFPWVTNQTVTLANTQPVAGSGAVVEIPSDLPRAQFLLQTPAAPPRGGRPCPSTGLR